MANSEWYCNEDDSIFKCKSVGYDLRKRQSKG